MQYLLFFIVLGLLIIRILTEASSGVLLNTILFLASGILILQAANILVQGITRIAQYLKWREFVIAFFVMAIGGSLPNLFVGIFSAVHDIPEFSFGDIVGNGLADLTLVTALAVFLSKGLVGESRLIQTSVLFATIVAILPMLLILDGQLGRGDGLALILIFVFYSIHLLSKRQLFDGVYTVNNKSPIREFKVFLQSLGGVIFGAIMMGVSAQAVIETSTFFAAKFNVPIALIGILIVGLGSALPETYFTIASARKTEKDWIILGVLMGSVVVLSTLILGIVALLNPIEIEDFSPFAIARFFLVISALLFLLFLRTGKKITKKEALVLLGLYILFVIAELAF